MKKLKVIKILIASIILTACSTVPFSGRKQLNAIPESSMLAMSYQQYDDFLKENKLSTNFAQTNMVKRVGKKLELSVENYFKEKGEGYILKDYAWDFNLIDSDVVNAWCMPGGKVVIYTGILPITQNEAGLAVVMCHEIAHAIAKHGNERMTQELIRQAGGLALAKAMEEQPEKTQALWFTVYGIGTELGVVLPYSRLHENEADHMGLIFMAMAGYDPNAAISFWERMDAQSGGQAPPEFLSTHPSHSTRIKKIREAIPEAMTYYKK